MRIIAGLANLVTLTALFGIWFTWYNQGGLVPADPAWSRIWLGWGAIAVLSGAVSYLLSRLRLA